jgi:formylmethanofuran dehydrogenase subunit E
MAGKTRTMRIASHPLLSKLWDNSNEESPNDFGIGNSSRRFLWICPSCQKTFKAYARDVLNTGLCNKCAYKNGAKKRVSNKIRSGKVKTVVDDDFLMKYWAADLNLDNPALIAIGTEHEYNWYCPNCGEPFKRRVSQMKNGSGLCKGCAHKQATAKHEAMMLANSKSIAEIPELIADWDYTQNTIDPANLSYGSSKLAKWICRECHKTYPRKIVNQYHSTHLCKECAAKQGNENHRKNMAIYNESVADRSNLIALWDWEKNTRDPHDLSAKSGIEVFWKCPDCQTTWKDKPCNRYDLLPHCMRCSMRIHNNRRNERAIAEGGTWGANHPRLAKQWHPTLNGDITPFDITPNCCTPYYFLCDYGHTYKVAPRERSERRAGCPFCNEHRRKSFTEQAIGYYLSKVIEVKCNYRILRNSELDVYIPTLKTAIEFDGLYWHSKITSIRRDLCKDEYCKRQGIRLIRVKEWRYNRNGMNTIYFVCKNDNYEWLIHCLCEKLKLPKINVNIIKDTPSILERLDLINIETSIAIKRPNAVAFWNSDKNYPITPEKIGYKSRHVFAWHCPECGNDFEESVIAVSERKYICKKCGQKYMRENISKAKRLYYKKKKQ